MKSDKVLASELAMISHGGVVRCRHRLGRQQAGRPTSSGTALGIEIVQVCWIAVLRGIGFEVGPWIASSFHYSKVIRCGRRRARAPRTNPRSSNPPPPERLLGDEDSRGDAGVNIERVGPGKQGLLCG